MAGPDRSLDGAEEWGDPPSLEDGPRTIEPGRPSAEDAAFVVLGALCALYVIARLAGLI